MSEKVTAIVLSGGQGRRFGSQDKGLVNWRGKPLVSHVIDRLRAQTDQLIINCNRNIEEYRAMGYEVCSDLDNNFLGPLAGVQAAVPKIQHRWCLVCPNDVPLLPDNLVARLLDALQSGDCQIAYPVCGPRHHYLPALIRTETLRGIDDYLQSGGRSLHQWYSRVPAITVDYSDQPQAFANINSPATLADLND